MQFLLLALLSTLLVWSTNALYQGKFVGEFWDFSDEVQDRSARVKFVVALKLRNHDEMHRHFLDISDPYSTNYGKYLTARELDKMYGPSIEAKRQVKAFFESVPGTHVHIADFGDLMEVTSPIWEIEKHLNTELAYVSHTTGLIPQKSLRSRTELAVPESIAKHIAFISLNSPVNHVKARGAKAVQRLLDREGEQANTVYITAGNNEALVRFQAYCGDGSVNNYNPPCSNGAVADVPLFNFAVSSYTNTKTNTWTITTDPTDYVVTANKVYCYNNATKTTCDGTGDAMHCYCLAKITQLPKYTQLRVNITATYGGSTVPVSQGVSTRFALTDVATTNFLADLYQIPPSIRVNYGSNQSVAEFYEEFYSNSDLETFLAYSGLPNATIPESNVYGDLPNDQSDPGGEAQLDVEYIMALAPGAETYFYSMADYNPNDPVNATDRNEGFLEYLYTVDTQEYPPLVHSLSYGDIENVIFNATNNGSVEYGERCNQEFMQMGLRGLTVLFSSGDDGIGSAIIRDNEAKACEFSHPEWPASSPYVTSVGATQLTDKYLPICGQQYSAAGYAWQGLPPSSQLDVQCSGTGETVCTSIFGGVITSGGGFSDVLNRSYYAPWQENVVDYYLRAANSENYPPAGYFNSLGRGYPDVATYGSNYFIYLNGQITRESGTSASAPVFAAMVTLWNDIRLAYGKPPMGFIAPFLYYIYEKNPDAFHDIVTGNNACGVGSSIDTAPCCDSYFAAVPGWDAVTGLGSPNFQIISSLIINNATAFPNLGAYPEGVSQQVVVDNTDDSNDDNVETMSTVALSFGVVGFVFGAVALGLFFWFGFSKGGQGMKESLV